LRQPDAPATNGDAERRFLLEAHTYSEGLRVAVLGRVPERPAWAPPHDYVGFRNEMHLRPGEYVVEFARFLHNASKATWVAVFKRAVDEIYGDRQNHAGVGLWLLGHDVLYAEPLLTTLQAFADAAARNEVLDAAADGFTQSLPDFLQPSAGLPPPLAGWPYSPSRISESATFVASAPDLDDAWMLAADQLMRATLLPPPTQHTARALILVRQAGADEAQSEAGAALRALTAPELVKSLPAAFEGVKEEARNALAEAQAALDRARQREAELSQAREGQARLEQQLTALKEEAGRLRGEIEASDPNRERALLHEAVKDLSRQLNEVKGAVHTARHELLTEMGSIKRGNQNQRHQLASAHLQDPGGSKSSKRWAPRSNTLIFVAAVAFLVVLVALLILYWPSPAAPEPVIETRAGPLDPER
jgi:hypothetical protein